MTEPTAASPGPDPPAAAPASPAPAPVAAPAAPADDGRADAPSLGTRIQVLWRLTFDDEPEAPATPQPSDSAPAAATGATRAPVEQWWGAVVQDCTPARVSDAESPAHAGRRVYVLLYDALHGFVEETSRVAFGPGRQLLDLAQLDSEHGGVLDWRLDGETDADDADTDVHSVRAWADEVDEVVREAGIDADADLRALAAMPHAKQMRLATGFRSFADALKARLAALVATKPDGYVVTKDDINSIMAELRGSNAAVAQHTGSLSGSVQ